MVCVCQSSGVLDHFEYLEDHPLSQISPVAPVYSGVGR